MTQKPMIQTERLILRQWEEKDFAPFAALNADPRVREYFVSVLSQQESDQMIKSFQAEIEKRGWGLWAVSLVADDRFIGFIGLNVVDQTSLPAPFSPAVEVGWRLAYPFWGKGLATEGALACLQYGFETLGLQEIVSFTAVQNQRSRAVMERIGMHHHMQDDFDHPKVPEGHHLRRHVLYRLEAQEWQKQNNRGC